MLRGWIQSKSANASTHSLDTLAEPQHRTYLLIPLLSSYTDIFLQWRRLFEVILRTRYEKDKADGMPDTAAAHIMNDDLESAEAGLTDGTSSFHKVCQIPFSDAFVPG